MPEPPDFKAVMETIPTRVAFSYARYEPGEERPPKPGETVRLAIDEPPPKEVVVVLQFSEKGFGFGEIAIHQTPEGVFVDTEHMSLDRVKRYFNELLDSAITDNDMDPVKHALYNKVTRRQCGPACPVCNRES